MLTQFFLIAFALITFSFQVVSANTMSFVQNYSGTWQDENVSLSLTCDDYTCQGSANILGAVFPLTAVIETTELIGELESGDTEIGFSAYFEAEYLRFTTGERSYLLSRTASVTQSAQTQSAQIVAPPNQASSDQASSDQASSDQASSDQASSVPAMQDSPGNLSLSAEENLGTKHLNILDWNIKIDFSWEIETQKTAMVNHRAWSIVTAPSARIEYYILPGPFQNISDALGDFDLLKTELGLTGNLAGPPKSVQVFNLPAIQTEYAFRTSDGAQLSGFVTTVFGFRKTGIILFTLAETVDYDEAKSLDESILFGLDLSHPTQNEIAPTKTRWQNSVHNIPESITINDNGTFEWEKPGQSTERGTTYKIGNTLILDTGSLRYSFYLSDNKKVHTLSRGSTVYTN